MRNFADHRDTDLKLLTMIGKSATWKRDFISRAIDAFRGMSRCDRFRSE